MSATPRGHLRLLGLPSRSSAATGKVRASGWLGTLDGNNALKEEGVVGRTRSTRGEGVARRSTGTVWHSVPRSGVRGRGSGHHTSKDQGVPRTLASRRGETRGRLYYSDLYNRSNSTALVRNVNNPQHGSDHSCRSAVTRARSRAAAARPPRARPPPASGEHKCANIRAPWATSSTCVLLLPALPAAAGSRTSTEVSTTTGSARHHDSCTYNAVHDSTRAASVPARSSSSVFLS